MDKTLLLTTIVSLITALVGFVSTIITTYRDLRRRKEKNPSPSQPDKDSTKNI